MGGGGSTRQRQGLEDQVCPDTEPGHAPKQQRQCGVSSAVSLPNHDTPAGRASDAHLGLGRAPYVSYGADYSGLVSLLKTPNIMLLDGHVTHTLTWVVRPCY